MAMEIENELDNKLVNLFNAYTKHLNDIIDRKDIEDLSLEKQAKLKIQFLDVIKNRLFSEEDSLNDRLLCLR